jgi:hypothetical protein
MTLLEELKQEPLVLEAISALGENDEELHFCCTAKQLSATKKKKRVALGLTHLALYIFDMETGPKYLRCMQRIRAIELTGIYVAKGGLVSFPCLCKAALAVRFPECHLQIATLCCVDQLDNTAV